MLSKIRIDHNILDLEIRGIDLHICHCREEDDEGECYTERKQNSACTDNADELYEYAYDNAKECHDISLKAEKRENQRVFEYFKHFQIKCEHLYINVVSHHKVQDEEYYIAPEHRVGKVAAVTADKHTIYIPDEKHIYSRVYHTKG